MSYNKHQWIHGELITAEKLNGIEEGIDCVANCSCLWVNGQPENEFAAQDIAVDTSMYVLFEICFITKEENSYQNLTISINKSRSYKHNGAWHSLIKHGNYVRYVTIDDSKISFSDCKYGINYNSKLIPYSVHAFV